MKVQPTGVEARFDARDLLVSKTDVRGVIRYANQSFIAISGYTEDELLGSPHALVRHPNMPRSVFSLMWDTIKDGKEIFAFVQNLAKDGRHYWVLAHVTPDIDPSTGEITGFHSSRRRAPDEAIRRIRKVYAALIEVESQASSRREACELGRAWLTEQLTELGQTYESFVLDLYGSSAETGPKRTVSLSSAFAA